MLSLFGSIFNSKLGDLGNNDLYKSFVNVLIIKNGQICLFTTFVVKMTKNQSINK